MIGPGATVADALRQATAELAAAGIERPRHEARLLVGHVLGVGKEAILAHPDGAVDAAQLERLHGYARRRAAHEPLAYLTREREFWSLLFEVSPATLIPRPESELLVEAALDFARTLPAPLRVLDLGTGSGCLLLALLSELPEAHGLGVDVSEAAIRVATRNAERLGLASRSWFVVGDWAGALAGGFDLVLCNPPYVAEAERPRLAPDVAAYEPAQALFGGQEGLGAYRAIAPALGRLLSSGGAAFVELGAGVAQPVATMFTDAGLSEIERRKDLAGIDRCAIFAGHTDSLAGRKGMVNGIEEPWKYEKRA